MSYTCSLIAFTSHQPKHKYSTDTQVFWPCTFPYLHVAFPLEGAIPFHKASQSGCLICQHIISSTGPSASPGFHGALRWRKRKGKTKLPSGPGAALGERTLKAKGHFLTVQWKNGCCISLF